MNRSAMKHLFITPLALLILALPALAEETATTPGVTNTSVPSVTQPKPPVPQGMPVPKPGTVPAQMLKENAEERKDLYLQNQQERKELMGENQAERKEFRENLGSSTPPGPARGELIKENVMERKELFLENQAERKELFLQNQEERRELLSENVALRREAFASSTAAKIVERRENIAERKEHFASTTALRKAEFTEAMKERILSHAEHAAELLDAMLTRLTGIADRIAIRIGELADQGVDVSSSETELEEAYDAIEAAGDAIEAVKVEIAEALDSENPGEMMREAKTAGDTAKQALRTAHEALKEAATSLPKPPLPEEVEATNE